MTNPKPPERHERIVTTVIFGFILSALCFLIAMQWLHQMSVGRTNMRLATIETQLREERLERTTDAVATRILILALVSRPQPPMEQVVSDVKKATAPHSLSPVLVQLLDELRKRKIAAASAAAPGPAASAHPRVHAAKTTPHKVRARAGSAQPKKRH